MGKMDNEDIHILRELVTKGELGDVSYDRKLLVTKLEAPRSLYVMGGFSVLEAATSEGPLLVYRDTHQALVRMEHGQLVPSTIAHLHQEFKRDDVQAYIKEQVEEEIKVNGSALHDRCTWHIPAYKDHFLLV